MLQVGATGQSIQMCLKRNQVACKPLNLLGPCRPGHSHSALAQQLFYTVMMIMKLLDHSLRHTCYLIPLRAPSDSRSHQWDFQYKRARTGRAGSPRQVRHPYIHRVLPCLHAWTPTGIPQRIAACTQSLGRPGPVKRRMSTALPASSGMCRGSIGKAANVDHSVLCCTSEGTRRTPCRHQAGLTAKNACPAGSHAQPSTSHNPPSDRTRTSEQIAHAALPVLLLG